MEYKAAIFIGRFQPFHKGHLYSLNKCLELAEQVIVGVGSSEESATENNPWDYETRKKMILSVRKDLIVVPIPDFPSDDDWVSYVGLNVIAEFGYMTDDVVVVSNNDWVTDTLGQAGYPTYHTGLFRRKELEGTKIRAAMRSGDSNYKKYLVPSVVDIAGIIK